MAHKDEIYSDVFMELPLGLFILDEGHHIIAWNTWMCSKTNLSEEVVHHKTIESLFPDINYSRFHWALEQVFSFGAPQVLSQILNHYLIPIPFEKNRETDIAQMQQHVEVLPIKKENGFLALVVIRDVTNEVLQKMTLMEMAKKLEDESAHDALTGIYNRRIFWESLTQEVARAKRSNQPLACLMFDIDYFKTINDQLGHQQGDQLLIDFVNIVKSVIRSSDVFFRLGGDEFALLIPNCDSQKAVLSAKRIRDVCEKQIHIMIDNHKVTCSIGIAIWDSVNANLPTRELVDCADKALYKAKEGGRDRVVVY